MTSTPPGRQKAENSSPSIALRAKRLKEAATKVQGGSQELASRTSIPYTTLRQYIRGETDIPTDKMVQLAEATGVSVAWLATGKGQMEPFEGDEFRALNDDARRVVKLITFYNEKLRLGLNPDQLGAAWFKIVNTIADREAAGLDKWDPAPMIELMEKEKGPAEPPREPE
jgi:transcriptional regulator with XRE-family HTH domain